MRYEAFEEKMNNQSTKIILDTNVILDLARYSLVTSKNILEIFKECEENLWIPDQVLKEYKKNKDKVFGDLKKRYSSIEKKLLSILDDFDKKTNKALNIAKRYKYFKNDNFSDKIKSKNEEYKKIIESMKDNLGVEYYEITSGSPGIINEINNFVSRLEENKQVGNSIGFNEQLELIKEGEFRFKYKIAPGYKDNEKEGIEKFGDFFIWKEILKLPTKNRFLNIIFITSDEKDDWWSKDQRGNIEIKGELRSEFLEKNPYANISIMTLSQFQEYASKLYNLTETNAYIDLNKNDESYISRVETDIAEEIHYEIESNGYSYLYSADLGDGGICGIDIVDCSLLNFRTIEPYSDDNEYVVYYELEYDITLSCISYEDWGQDDDTREFITSPPIEHEFSGIVVASIRRDIPLKDIRSDFNHDFLNKDTTYTEFEIIDSNLEQIYVNKNFDLSEDYE